MSFFGNAFKHPGWYAGGPLPGLAMNNFGQPESNVPGPAPWNPITAKNTAIPAGLLAAFGNVGAKAKENIGGNYDALAKRNQAEAGARGLGAGSNSYAAERLPAQQALDIGGLESALGGDVGRLAYENRLQERDYGQNLSLADEIAALNRPSTLEEIFGGAGAVGKPVATYYGMRGRGGSGGVGRMPRSEWEGAI